MCSEHNNRPYNQCAVSTTDPTINIHGLFMPKLYVKFVLPALHGFNQPLDMPSTQASNGFLVALYEVKKPEHLVWRRLSISLEPAIDD